MLTKNIWHGRCGGLYLRTSLKLQSMKYDVSCLVPLDALPGVVEELVQGGGLALLQGEVVQDLVRRHPRLPGVDPGLHQDVLRVQHLGHGQTVTEPLVHGGQGVLHRAGWFQSL